MGKIANRYLEVLPFAIEERGYHKERHIVSESLFSLSNEYCGIRGVFDEGISAPSLRGSYFNGIYDYAKEDTPIHYKGIIQRTHFMVNSVDWVKVKIVIEGRKLDLAVSDFYNFNRVLDFKRGLLTRSFTWNVKDDLQVHIMFERFVSMVDCHMAFQRITISSNRDTKYDLTFYLDSNVVHWGKDVYFKPIINFKDGLTLATINRTLTTRQKVAALMEIVGPGRRTHKMAPLCVYEKLTGTISAKETLCWTRHVVNLVDKIGNRRAITLWRKGKLELVKSLATGFDQALKKNEQFWADVWHHSDIEIAGDPINQQGIRYNIFQLYQTYHGFDGSNNIGAKGLTGEAYSGHAFWDSETYCLPFYLFNHPASAKNLLMFRYHTLGEAKKRASMLDCQGACYPIATLNGKEGCNLWQHASLQFQPSTGVAYGIYHYVNVTQDIDFLLDYGLEMLLEISRFLLTRGQWNAAHTHFGYYGVMGPDEFQLMVNHNTYTNYMAKRTFDYTLEVLKKHGADNRVNAILNKTKSDASFINDIKQASSSMLILYDESTQLYEQHQGFFDLPHIDPHSIPVQEFPLYAHWSYDRIYRNDLIKQPDVLMFMFLYNQSFSFEEKKKNYEFYEPKTIHESSLSPSVHSILASELDKEQEALSLFSFATRMDLDDYNRNSNEGLHTTSIAAAWMNIVYGFGGLRSDGSVLTINPHIPDFWKSYRFYIYYHGKHIGITVTKNDLTLESEADKTIDIKIGNQIYAFRNNLSLKWPIK